MSREEIEKKLPTELIIFIEFMDSILPKYEFKIGNYKVNNEFGDYILEVLSWHNKNNYSDIISQSWMWIS